MIQMAAGELSSAPLFVLSASRVVPRTAIVRGACKISLHRTTLPRVTNWIAEGCPVEASPTNSYLACGLQLSHFSAA
jgi:hypothetical protein